MIRTALAAAALIALPQPLLAQAVEEKNLLSGKATLDSASGYIFLQAPMRTFGTFLRVPDAATQAEHQKDWDEAFAKAQKKYASALKQWESDVAIAKQTKAKAPDKPVEPTKENFRIAPIEMRDMIAFGPMFIFNKSETRFTYLNKVKPGTYIYYGPLMVMPAGGAAGQCYCMGTVQFEVKPGVVTDLGNFLIAGPSTVKNWDVASADAWRRAEEKAARSGKPVEPPLGERPAVAFGVPDTLKALPAVQADFRASGKLNNFYGVLISRMPPIPGVLDYRRDTVVDVKAGADVPNPAIITQVKIKT